jgi:hypothetical protein
MVVLHKYDVLVLVNKMVVVVNMLVVDFEN